MTSALQVSRTRGRWQIAGEGAELEDFELCNDYLAYLADRRYSPRPSGPTPSTSSTSPAG